MNFIQEIKMDPILDSMLKELTEPYIYNNELEEAADKGDMEKVIYYYISGTGLTEITLTLACKSGNLKLVKFLVEQKCPMHATAIGQAVLYGHIEIVKYLVDNNAPLTLLAMYNACIRGDILMINYLFRINAPFDYICVYAAASNNHVDVLECFYKAGIPLKSDIIIFAELGGFLDIVKFMYSINKVSKERVLSVLDKHYDKVNLSDIFWYMFLLNTPTGNYKNITKLKKRKLWHCYE